MGGVLVVTPVVPLGRREGLPVVHSVRVVRVRSGQLLRRRREKCAMHTSYRPFQYKVRGRRWMSGGVFPVT